MFWDDAESEEKVKKDKKEEENAAEGESIDDYQGQRPGREEEKTPDKGETENGGRKPSEPQSKPSEPQSKPSEPQSKPPEPQGSAKPPEPQGSAKPPVPQGSDKPPVPQGSDKPPVPQGSAKPPVPQGSHKPPEPQGSDKPPVPQGSDKPPVQENKPPVPQGSHKPPVPGGEQTNEDGQSDEVNSVNDQTSDKDKQKALNDQETKTVYTDKSQEENPEYVFVPTNRKDEEESKGDLLFGVLRIVASAPVIVSFFSLSHIIRKIPVKYLMIGSAIAPLHFILSLLMISDMTKEDTSKDVAYTSLTKDTCPPLSIVVSIYLFVMKYLTCIFMVDMFLETIYAIFPDFRLDEFSLGFAKIFFLFLITLFLVILILTYKSLPIALHGFNIALIASAIILLICIVFFSRLEVRRFANVSSSNSQINITDILFLSFSFISFACECQSVSVMVFKKNKSGHMVVSILSVLSILFFLFLLFYFGDWILQKSLSETLNIILPSYSDFNRSLRDSKSDSFNLLSRSSFFACLVISLIGFVLQMNILSRSLISIFSFLKRASDLVGFIVTFSLVLSLVILVVLKDIGRILWMITRIIFFGFPFYAMYPYLAEVTNEKANKVMFIMSIVLILGLCFFLYLSFYDVSILKPSKM